MVAGHSLHCGTTCRGRRITVTRGVSASWRRIVSGTLRCIFAVVPVLWLTPLCPALIVGNEPNVVPSTTVNPAAYAGWTQGDPGWNNVSASGSNYVYLGDGWVLSARHVGYNSANGVQFQTESGPVTFHRISGSYYLDYGYGPAGSHNYAVSNPASVQLENGQSMTLADSVGTNFTDLQLFRIDGDPGLPTLTIASQASPSLPSNFSRTNAPQVVLMSNGAGRVAAQTQWNVTQISQDNWVWNQTAGAGTHQGYFSDAIRAKRWGTNRLADPRPNGSGDPSDPGATDYSSLFSSGNGIISDTAGVFKLKTPDGVTRDIIAMMTVFDQQGQPGAVTLETQAIPGDSGSAVFYKNGSQWQLAGIVNATFNYEDQPVSTAVYGNATLFTDLSYYYYPDQLNGQPHPNEYSRSISDIIRSHPDYSVMGDVNLDGEVTGNGTGPATTDDVTAFVAGWGYDNGPGPGNITSWMSGDLDRDGDTDVYDFLQLRDALNGQISGAVLTALFGSSGVPGPPSNAPEPASIVLALAAAAFLAAGLRQRRSALV